MVEYNLYNLDWWKYTPPEPTEEELFWTITEGDGFVGYSQLHVHLKGPTSSRYNNPIESFEEAGLHPSVMRNLERSRFRQLTPVQKYALPIIFDHRDLLACAQTGSGKTAAYVLPLVSNLLYMDDLPGYNEVPSPLVLVLVPTRELAAQVYVDFRRFTDKTNIQVVGIYGGCNARDQVEKLNRRTGCHIVVATPGRLFGLLDNPPSENFDYITLDQVRYLILDEADRMLETNKSIVKKEEGVTRGGFFYDVEKLLKNYAMSSKVERRQTLMFSATFPKRNNIVKVAENFLHNYVHLYVGDSEEGGTFSDIHQEIINIKGISKLERLVELIQNEVMESSSTKTVVFVNSKRLIGKVVEDLTSFYLSVTDLKSGNIDGVSVIVAIPADIPRLLIKNVSQVLNYSPENKNSPKIEEYVSDCGGKFVDVHQEVERQKTLFKEDRLVEILKNENGRKMVFVTTKRQAAELTEYLDSMGFPAADIQSNRMQEEREGNLRQFKGAKDGEPSVSVIVATAAAARGLDIANVKLVVNYDLPNTDFVGVEEYIHKIGRTGRIGNSGRAISFFDPEKDKAIALTLINVLSESSQLVPYWLKDFAYGSRH